MYLYGCLISGRSLCHSKHYQRSTTSFLCLRMKRSLTVQPSLDQFFKKYAPPPAKPAEPKLVPTPSPPSPKLLVRSISTRNPETERTQETTKKREKREQIITDLSEPPEVSGDIIKQSPKVSKPSVSFSSEAKKNDVRAYNNHISLF